ncbi:MAG: hypothetical protein K6F53_11600 [Lachnospiraceae bacterium]|nr:hypothetical protein [Lachnospiraceae bacterium]
MKEKLTAALAILMSVILAFSSVMLVRYIRAYADETDEKTEENYEDGTGDPDSPDGTASDGEWDGERDGSEAEPTPTPTLAPEPEPGREDDEEPEDDEPHYIEPEDDPFIYSLSCYTPKIDFGTIGEGQYEDYKPFSIINTGNSAVPLDWYAEDPYTSFWLEFPEDLDLAPGEQANFSVRPDVNLLEGTYNASYTFYSANDIRRHNPVTVSFKVRVVRNDPYVYRVEISPGSADVPAGKSVKFKANVYGEYDYDSGVTWAIHGQKSRDTFIDSNGQLNVAAAESATTITVTATSRQTPSEADNVFVSVSSYDHMVSVSASPAEGGNVTGGGSIRNGGSLKLNQSANNNYRFVGWFENNAQISTASQLDLKNITGDRSIQARFERVSCRVKAAVNNTAAGTVTGGGSVDYGGNVTLEAKANDGYTFEGFVENNKTISTSPSLQINNITSDRKITAVFRQSRFAVSVSANPANAGKVEGGGQYQEKAKVTVKAKAEKGYDFLGWTLNGQTVAKTETYVIKSIQNNYNLVANFAAHNTPNYKISSMIANQGGGIVPSGDNLVAEGSNVVYNIVPLSGYRILAVAVDGVNVGAVSQYTFANVKAAHSIAASFAKIEDTVQAKDKKTAVTDDSVKKTESTPKPAATYTEDSAARGALPEQVILDDGSVPTSVDELSAQEISDLNSFSSGETISEDYAPADFTGGILAKYSLSEEQARTLIRQNGDLPLLRSAFEEGYLQITVNSSFADVEQETSVEMYYPNPTLHNFEDVIATSLSEDEKLAVLNGTEVSFNVNLTENEEIVPESIKKLIQKRVGYKELDYFNYVIMKTMDSESKLVSTTEKELETTIVIPEKYRKAGRNYCILREHNGSVDVLTDLDDFPDTITFRTNKFSQYAIAYEALNVNVMILVFFGVTFVALIFATVCYVNLVRYRRKARRARKAGQDK